MSIRFDYCAEYNDLWFYMGDNYLRIQDVDTFITMIKEDPNGGAIDDDENIFIMYMEGKVSAYVGEADVGCCGWSADCEYQEWLKIISELITAYDNRE